MLLLPNHVFIFLVWNDSYKYRLAPVSQFKQWTWQGLCFKPWTRVWRRRESKLCELQCSLFCDWARKYERFQEGPLGAVDSKARRASHWQGGWRHGDHGAEPLRSRRQRMVVRRQTKHINLFAAIRVLDVRAALKAPFKFTPLSSDRRECRGAVGHRTQYR